ncbi:ferrochelatase [Aeromicrobium alkaliterrae]|uniref:Coproporphyrin III ferrochelatase n=1 Tax=Aeromicrobium alkaliterrae TaxID=302168 RepID=A0ABN2JI68_9ACTN
MHDTAPLDAILLVSFGGPEHADEVVPFLENVTRGKGIPKERLVEVGEHYFGFGGRSPINDANRALMAGIQADLAENGVDLPVYWGNRNWDPYLRETLEQMVADGHREIACFVTSAYSSYSGCRQYREDLFEASEGLDVRLHRLRHYFNHPGFVEPVTDAVRAALDAAPDGTRLVFVTHSIPDTMNEASGGPGAFAYERQHREVARLVSDAVGHAEHDLVYCSRSGPPQVPWLEPDVNDHLEKLSAQGVTSVAVVPIGFISDHMEVVYDLDTEASATAAELGLTYVRVGTPDTADAFIAMVRDLVLERAAALRGEDPDRATLGDMPPWADHCAADCCLNARSTRTALA